MYACPLLAFPTDAYHSQSVPIRVNDTLPPADVEPTLQNIADIPEYLVDSVDGLIAHLDQSARLRVENIPKPANDGSARVAVLFSGGIDSTMCAFLAHKYAHLFLQRI